MNILSFSQVSKQRVTTDKARESSINVQVSYSKVLKFNEEGSSIYLFSKYISNLLKAAVNHYSLEPNLPCYIASAYRTLVEDNRKEFTKRGTYM